MARYWVGEAVPEPRAPTSDGRPPAERPRPVPGRDGLTETVRQVVAGVGAADDTRD